MDNLVSEVAKHDSQLAKRIAKVKSLTIYAVTYRYPDAERKSLTTAKVKSVIRTADRVLKLILLSIR